MLEGTASPLDNGISTRNHLENWINVLGEGSGGNSAVSGVKHSTCEGIINSIHSKGQQPLTVQFWRNNLYIVVDQSENKPDMSKGKRRRHSSKIVPENTTHGNSFGWSALSSFHPVLHLNKVQRIAIKRTQVQKERKRVEGYLA